MKIRGSRKMTKYKKLKVWVPEEKFQAIQEWAAEEDPYRIKVSLVFEDGKTVRGYTKLQ